MTTRTRGMGLHVAHGALCGPSQQKGRVVNAAVRDHRIGCVLVALIALLLMALAAPESRTATRPEGSNSAYHRMGAATAE